ncbi:MAG: protein kinase, partial [Azoarcus sp.]|nr:protein kinase [Azoarcus sp.]
MTPRREISALPEGTRVGGFTVGPVLGGGKSSLVYKGVDDSLLRTVVLKEYFPAESASRRGSAQVEAKPGRQGQFEDGLRRFGAEAGAMSSFRSPVLREVLQYFAANGTAYIVMPYLEGKTLRQMVRGGWRATGAGDLLAVILPILEGVFTLHKAGYGHFGISPGNILVQDGGRPVLIDFGAARRMGRDTTQFPVTDLSPGFAAKEQYYDAAGDGESGPGTWTDIYGISAVAYYIVTGNIPEISISRVAHDALRP